MGRESTGGGGGVSRRGMGKFSAGGGIPTWDSPPSRPVRITLFCKQTYERLELVLLSTMLNHN